MTLPCHAGSAGKGRLGAAVVAGENGAGQPVPDRARELAGRLSALFERDVEIVERLNDAQRRLHGVNERRWPGLTADAFGLVYDGAAPRGESQIAARRAGRSGSEQLLQALQQIHWTIRGAFRAYQDACEERRRLAVEVGEVSQELTGVLCAVGRSADDAHGVDLLELRNGGSDELGAAEGCSRLTANQGHG